MNILRHRADAPAIVLVLVVALVQLYLYLSIDNWILLALLTATLMLVQVSSGAICHNHHHVSIFTRAVPNRLLEVIMYLQTGTSPLSWTIHHNIGHHGYYLNQKEDPSHWQLDNGRMMGRAYYDLYNSLMIYPQIWRIGQCFPKLFAQFKRWFIISNLLLLALIVYRPMSALIVFVLPMMLMLIILLDNTYLQHSGLDTCDHYHASRNILHPLYNLTSWNLGYHTAHHMHPGLHWTKLPAVHQRIENNIPVGLISYQLLPCRSELKLAINPDKQGQQPVKIALAKTNSF